MSRASHDIPRLTRLFAWLGDYSGAIVIILCAGAFFGWTIAATLTGHHDHDGYVLADVQFTFGGTHGPGRKANIRLPDGSVGIVAAMTVAQSGEFLQTVCVERRLQDDGKVHYNVAPRDKCPEN